MGTPSDKRRVRRSPETSHSLIMRYIIVRTIGILLTSYITKVGVPIVVAISTGWTALLVALALAVINHTIKPVISIISIPVNLVTLGLFSFGPLVSGP